MIVVMGHLVVAADDREASLALSLDAVQAARAAPGCLHFAVTADPVEPTWVDVAELWTSRSELDAFRTSGDVVDDGSDPFVYVREFHVEELEVGR
jgi:quinol monooxygenase YgiN